MFRFCVVFLIFLVSCIGYNTTYEKANISNSLSLNAIYGASLGTSKNLNNNKNLFEGILNFEKEREFYHNYSLNFILTWIYQNEKFTNFEDTSSYLRLNVGLKNSIFKHLSLKFETIYDVDLLSRPIRPFNQKYFYGNVKLIYDYGDLSFYFSTNSFSVNYKKSIFYLLSSIYIRSDYTVPIFNIGLGVGR